MNTKIFIIAILLVTILFAGCTGNSNSNSNVDRFCIECDGSGLDPFPTEIFSFNHEMDVEETDDGYIIIVTNLDPVGGMFEVDFEVGYDEVVSEYGDTTWYETKSLFEGQQVSYIGPGDTHTFKFKANNWNWQETTAYSCGLRKTVQEKCWACRGTGLR
ncbi:hypothetical protein LI82_04090 [Methanococcoides methylutens]|uniref:Uncharacterized protein n=1 Tax=Methanococcoides methylutens TaxID=2226 RepID=A0A099T4X9_METMT|nr:hypothetical protein [Methanococcoides methylutens]KGK99213.1 hypothetical protein LI82_04090 [Methanococcoides methylutens]